MILPFLLWKNVLHLCFKRGHVQLLVKNGLLLNMALGRLEKVTEGMIPPDFTISSHCNPLLGINGGHFEFQWWGGVTLGPTWSCMLWQLLLIIWTQLCCAQILLKIVTVWLPALNAHSHTHGVHKSSPGVLTKNYCLFHCKQTIFACKIFKDLDFKYYTCTSITATIISGIICL